MNPRPLFLAILLAASTSAHADPIRITSGFVNLGPPISPTDSQLILDLHADQLHLEGRAVGGFDQLRVDVSSPPDPIETGALANLSSRSTINFGFGTANGREVLWTGELVFITPDAPLSSCEIPGVDCFAVAPFRFNGLLHAFDFLSEAHVADFALHGRGQAQGDFDPFTGQFNYGFETAPVPESSTLLFLGSGIAGMTLRKRRRLWP